MITAQEALLRLKDGNRRYTTDSCEAGLSYKASREAVAKKQEPFAIILGCADSRVPAEVVFDQSIGDLFVVRVAGNIVTPSQLESIEFAATNFGSCLAVVLGHTSCGAVIATLGAVQEGISDEEAGLPEIVSHVRPAVAAVLDDPSAAADELVPRAIRANIAQSVEQLRSGSPALKALVDSGKLKVVGAEYSLVTGEVEFLDG